MEIRNIAMIAHVDHGKTTLTDALMQQAGMVKEETTMDSNDLEKERGITIYAKNTSIFYQGTKINIVDTPGHADFGSEVERVLRAVDAVLLIVDAQEGPMPQTKFVLKKSLELGLKPIVVINKIDKPAARIAEVEEEIFELFLDLGANDEQLEFTTVYTVAKQGIAKLNKEDNQKNNLNDLLDVILKEVPVASQKEWQEKEFRLQPFNLGYDEFLGRLAIGRIYEGKIKTGQEVFIKNIHQTNRKGKITQLFVFEGIQRKEVEEASAGEIVMLAGLPDIDIGETITKTEKAELLPAIEIDEPTITLNFLVNDSPFAGKEGNLVTNRQIRERLQKELEVNVGLKIDFSASDHYAVSGRGELHIAILLENMRREGYELQISQPQVIIKENSQGKKQEPFEEVIIEVPDEMSGDVIKKLGQRKGNLMTMQSENGTTRMVFEIPTRGLLGYRNEFVVDTRGEGIFYSRVIGFRDFVGSITRHVYGSMISKGTGKALGFSLYNLQERGILYIGAGEEVYEGMVIGNVSKGNDMVVNPLKGKHLTNMRASGSDEAIQLTPPLKLNLEKGMEIMKKDEYLEITPQSIRLRKQVLNEIERKRAKRK